MKSISGKDYFLNLKKNADLKRFGVTFQTSNNTYFYDAGTGKVVLLDEMSKPIILALFNEKTDLRSFESLLSNDKNTNYASSFFQHEHLLMRPSNARFYDLSPFLSESSLQCQQLIIELTGKCNLRCQYCIYNDHYEHNRAFNEEAIDFETVKKAIDYAYAHRSPKMFAIGFYGGEPLLNFKVMKQCIEYCLTQYKENAPIFSFTTNLTLMSKEIADFLAQVPNMSIIASIDGPKTIQNENRTFANGAPTFDAVLQGLRNLCDAIAKHNSNCRVNINTVFMPPYTEKRFSIINDFFESLSFLPPNTEVTATYPAPGSIPESFIERINSQGSSDRSETRWMDWAIEKMNLHKGLPDSPNLYSTLLMRTLGDIHFRRLSDRPFEQDCLNACCIPGNRRLYVCTNGAYKLCEKMGNSPYIGHVNSGINFEVIKDYYIDQYEEASIEDCSNCWAINLCSLCYSLCYEQSGINMETKRMNCEYARESALSNLQVYHEVLEKYPNIISAVSTLERS